MLLVRRGDGFPGAGDAFCSVVVSGAVLTRDAITPGVFRLDAVAVMSGTAQSLDRPRAQPGVADDERKLRNVLRLLAVVRH